MKSVFEEILRFAVLMLSLVIADRLFRGIYFDSFRDFILFGIVLFLLNRTLKPVLVLLTLPVSLMSFGFFFLLLNTLVLFLAAAIIPSIHIKSFWTGFWFATISSLIQLIINSLIFNDIQIKIDIHRE